ncbi:MAG: hypothetical protein WDA02_08455 [Saccharofermentanales bacterium]
MRYNKIINIIYDILSELNYLILFYIKPFFEKLNKYKIYKYIKRFFLDLIIILVIIILTINIDNNNDYGFMMFIMVFCYMILTIRILNNIDRKYEYKQRKINDTSIINNYFTYLDDYIDINGGLTSEEILKRKKNIRKLLNKK